MSTKLKDIAHLTGVSINTVSRALKDKPDIGEKTKERVKQAAKTLGYTPNIVARGLVLKRSFTIGLVVTELSNPTRGILVDALRQLAIAKGYQLLVSGYEGEADIEASIREMAARGVDGMILGNISGIISEKTFWPALESATRSGIPAVTFYEALTGRIDNVFVDYSLVTEELTRHLIEKHGFRKILFAANTLGYRRGEGYERAMRQAGLQKNIGLIPFNGWKMEDARKGIMDYLGAKASPEAIVCHNDLAMIGAIAGLREKGLKVPDDVAVTGVDNIEMAEYLDPKFTTAGVAPGKVAAELFRLLHDRIDGKYNGEARQVKLPFSIFLRESCGCTKKTTAAGKR